jgi:hypothetical protein
MILGGVGNRVDRFGARRFPPQWQHRLHSGDRGLLRLLIAATLATLRTVRQACKAPGWLALVGWYWWALDGQCAAYLLLFFSAIMTVANWYARVTKI